MLQDSSPDFEKTWKFLERRIEEASLVHDFLVKSEGATSHIQNAVGSAFSTVSIDRLALFYLYLHQIKSILRHEIS